MSKHSALAALAAVALAAGCRRHPEPDPDSVTGAPRPVWTSTEVTTVEGKRMTLTLTLSRTSASPSDVTLSTGGAGEILFPEVVTFPAGSVTQGVTVTALATEAGPTRDPELTATTPNGSSTVTIHILDDDADLGLAVGPVTHSTGIVVLAGAGADAVFATMDDEIIAAKNVGAGTPVLARTVAGALSGGPECKPVVSADGSVLALGVGAAPVLIQVQSVPDAPAVTATAILPAKLGGISRPVMIGTRAVVTSRGSDLLTSGDDALLVVDGIGTTTLTVKTIPLPGLAAGDPSFPVQLTATSLLITSAGPDFLFGTGDEVLTLVSALDTAAPAVVPLFAGRIRGDASGRALASAGTIAAVATAGADATFATVDDALQVVRNVLTAPAPALPLVVGPLASGDAGLPLSTGSDSAIIPTMGVDLLQGTVDDEVAAVFPLSSDPMAATPLAAMRTVSGLQGALVLVSSVSAVRLDPGVDGLVGGSDDGVRLFTNLGTATPAASTLVTGALQAFAPMPVDSASVALCGAGPDFSPGTDDDLTIRVAGIGGLASSASNPTGAFAPLSTPVLVPGISSGRSVAARTAGADASPGTPDDRLSVAASP